MDTETPAKITHPRTKRLDFWCDNCRKDIEYVEAYLRENRFVSWYVFRHQCNRQTRELIRYAEHLKDDPYFHQSAKVRRLALMYERDLVQSGDPRFAKYYPKQAQAISENTRKHTQRLKQEEEDQWRADKSLVANHGLKAKEALNVLKKEHPNLA